MKRNSIEPRPNWLQTVEDQGLVFAVDEGRPYWDESAYYQFSSAEIDRVEAATEELNQMCLAAVEHTLMTGDWDTFQVPPQFRSLVQRSWDEQEHTIYGRFDFWFDGRDIKLLEYNADTPTGLIEAAVAQWHWGCDCFGDQFDAFTSIHERLIEAWGALRQQSGESVLHVTSLDDGDEDFMTANYLRDTAQQAGFETQYIAIERIGWHPTRRVFTDENEREIRLLFKLYPWEWLAREKFGRYIPSASTRWIEAPWKILLSNKALLVVLWKLFPNHPLLLRSELAPWGDTYARKPLLGREGANTKLVRDGRELVSASGLYRGPFVYQELRELPSFEGNYPVCGSWLVNGWACGMGIREDSSLITGNKSRFVPHRILG